MKEPTPVLQLVSRQRVSRPKALRNVWRHSWFALMVWAMLAWVAPGFAADADSDKPSATYSVSTIDSGWYDAQRNRTLPVRLRVPQGARKAPVILYSHGLGSSRDGGRLWGEHWASFGYVVVHIQHPGSDSASNLRDANSLQQYLMRIQDVRFALDELARRQIANDPALAEADLTRIGMSGHSFGAQTTLAVSGMRMGDSIENGYRPFDPRITAALALSPTTAGPETAESDYPRRFGSIQMPFMTITGTEDGDASSRGYAWENRQIPFQHMPGPGKYLMVLKGADHWVYGGQPGATRPVRAQDTAITRWVRLATTAFWDAHLKNELTARLYLERLAASLGVAGTFAQK